MKIIEYDVHHDIYLSANKYLLLVQYFPLFPGIVYVTVDEGTPVVHHGTWIILNLVPTCVRITC